jgi:hypothetical protein
MQSQSVLLSLAATLHLRLSLNQAAMQKKLEESLHVVFSLKTS